MAGLCPKDAVPANAFMTGWPQEREYVDIPPFFFPLLLDRNALSMERDV
jgi:hypothetical protein